MTSYRGQRLDPDQLTALRALKRAFGDVQVVELERGQQQ
jgi:hypothetical protein